MKIDLLPLDFCKRATLFPTRPMRAVRATFLLLLFVTSFARCWADTYGVLAHSSWACCKPVSQENHDCHGDDSDHDHEKEHDHEPEPFPSSDCSGCSLVKAGFTSTGVDLNFNAPAFIAFVPEWDDLHLRVQRILIRAEDAQEPPPPWSIGQVIMTMTDIVTTSAVSVRGPNLV